MSTQTKRWSLSSRHVGTAAALIDRLSNGFAPTGERFVALKLFARSVKAHCTLLTTDPIVLSVTDLWFCVLSYFKSHLVFFPYPACEEFLFEGAIQSTIGFQLWCLCVISVHLLSSSSTSSILSVSFHHSSTLSPQSSQQNVTFSNNLIGTGMLMSWQVCVFRTFPKQLGRSQWGLKLSILYYTVLKFSTLRISNLQWQY